VDQAGKGSVSIVAKIKAKFEEDPEYFEEWISKLLEDPSNRKAVMEQIDGKPKQSIHHTTAGTTCLHFILMETITPTIRPTPKQELACEKLQNLTTRLHTSR
jgi:hypothetical protein